MATPAFILARRSKAEAKRQTVPSCEAQIAECSAWAAEHDFGVLDTFKDNLTASRFSTKDRPQFMQMMNRIRDGEVEAVLVTEQSRLDRQLWNILELIELARTTPFKMIVKVRDDEILDLATESGINRVIDQANRDRHESELISQRVKARKQVNADQGRFDGGPRPFGYEKDGVTVRESEAAIIRECAAKILAGASMNGLTRDLNDRGIPTASGGRWQRSTLAVIFRNKRIIGVRVYNGIEHEAQWPALISRDEWEQIQLILDARHTRKTRTVRSYLLTGMVICGHCGAHLVGSGHKVNGALQRRYYCVPEDSSGRPRGCGKVSRLADPLEALVGNAVVYRLDSEGLAKAFGQATQDDDMQAALAEYQETKTSLGGLLADYYVERNKYAKDEMLKLKAELEARLEQVTRKMERLDSTRILTSLPFGQTVRAIWDSADLTLKQSLVGLLIEKIVVLPGRSGATKWRDKETDREWSFDYRKVELHWKV
jgi:site-specific DNA recombinase